MGDFLELFDDTANRGYIKYHAPRFTAVMDIVGRYHTPDAAMLDIGQHYLTDILRATFQATVDTLGYGENLAGERGTNHSFDLNLLQSGQSGPAIGPYDIITFSEVLEHLAVQPEIVLGYLRSLLKPGGVLILQTPNAVALHRRLAMLCGRNPYQLLSFEEQNYGHIREYTRREITSFAAMADFEVADMQFCNYFDYRYADHRAVSGQASPVQGLINLAYTLCPPSLKPGMTFVLRAR